MSELRQPRGSVRAILIGLLVVGGIIAAALGLSPALRQRLVSGFSSGPGTVNKKYILARAENRPFRVMITENGTVDSLRNATLNNSVEGTTTIIALVAEGSRVNAPVVSEISGVVEFVASESESEAEKKLRVVAEDGTEKTYTVTMGEFTEILVTDRQKVKKNQTLAGDVVCELDSSTMVEKEKEQQIKLTTARANLEKAQKNIEIQETTNESNLAKARLAEELAQLDEDKYTAEGGEYEQAVATVRGEIKKYEEELAINREEYDRKRDETRRGYANPNQLESARIKVSQTQIQLQLKQRELVVLEKFTFRRTVSELKQLAEDTIRETARARLEGEAAMAQQRAELEAAQLTMQVEQEKLDLLQRQIADSRLVAPQAGEVVYASAKSNRGSEPVVIEEGATVRERQAIINLPDLENMKIDARIHESKISRVMVGQGVEIEIDAFPGDPYHGRLQTVSSVPVPGSWPNTDLKEYEAAIEITDSLEKVKKLKPGMTAQVRIIVEDRKEEVLQIPVQSVLSFGGQFFTYVIEGVAPVQRNIKVGDSNDEYMEVIEGVEVGEFVVMSPRTHFSEELSKLEQELSAEEEANRPRMEIPVRTPDTGAPGGGGAPGGARGDSAPGAGGGRGNGGQGNGGQGTGGQGGAGGGGAPRDPQAAFDAQDANKDGAITKDEATRPEFFDRMDANGDGKVTLEEMKTAMENFRRPQ